MVILSVVKANSYVKEYNDYIEVCSNGIAYVPFDTKFVKCRGIVLEVQDITRSLTPEEIDCECPKCCDGYCYIIAYGDPDQEPATYESDDDLNHEHYRGEINNRQGIIYLWFPCKDEAR